MNLSHKNVVLIGASGGIGRALAKALMEEGCRLLLVGRNQKKLDLTYTNLDESKHQKLVVDLAYSEGRSVLVAAAKRHQIDILINAIGVNELNLLDEMADEEIENMMSVNLVLPMQICRGVLPLLVKRPQSAIVNVGSILGSIGYAGSCVYCASKFGLRGFTEAMRRELADTHTRVLYFAPRATNTELNSPSMQHLNRELGNHVDEPEQVARELIKVLVGSGNPNRYLGWPEAFFVRLNALFPRLVDKAVLKNLHLIRQYAATSKLKAGV